MSQLNTAIEALRQNPGSKFDETSGILCKLLGNILANPEDDKYRKIRLSNAKINAAIVQVPGAIDILLAVGFVEDDGHLYISSTTALAAVQDALTQIQSVATQRAAKVAAQADNACSQRMAEAAKNKAENDRRKAAIKAKIAGNKKEEKEIVASVKKQSDFGSGTKNNAEQCGAAGNDDSQGG